MKISSFPISTGKQKYPEVELADRVLLWHVSYLDLYHRVCITPGSLERKVLLVIGYDDSGVKRRALYSSGCIPAPCGLFLSVEAFTMHRLN